MFLVGGWDVLPRILPLIVEPKKLSSSRIKLGSVNSLQSVHVEKRVKQENVCLWSVKLPAIVVVVGFVLTRSVTIPKQLPAKVMMTVQKLPNSGNVKKVLASTVVVVPTQIVPILLKHPAIPQQTSARKRSVLPTMTAILAHPFATPKPEIAALILELEKVKSAIKKHAY